TTSSARYGDERSHRRRASRNGAPPGRWGAALLAPRCAVGSARAPTGAHLRPTARCPPKDAPLSPRRVGRPAPLFEGVLGRRIGPRLARARPLRGEAHAAHPLPAALLAHRATQGLAHPCRHAATRPQPAIWRGTRQGLTQRLLLLTVEQGGGAGIV